MSESPYVQEARAAAARYGIPEAPFLRQINAESAWDPRARSSAGAMGLLQLMPATARSLGVSNPFDPAQSIDGGARYMSQLLHEFGGNLRLALAAYNAGPGNVRSGAWEHIPETVAYVDHILSGLDASTHSAPARSVLPQSSPQGMSNADFNLLDALVAGDTPSEAQLLAVLAGGSPSSPDVVQTSRENSRSMGSFKAPVVDLTSVGGRHETMGLPGYPAHDYFAPSGSPVVAPITGRVIKLSGHDPAEGPVEGPHGPLGWSVYIQAPDGHTYYLTHMGSRAVHLGQTVKAGQRIGTVADYAKYGTPSHIHMGVH